MTQGRYLAILFSDLERHSEAWTRVPRERMVAAVAEYRFPAESLASQYGALYLEWAGDGHMFLFESADAAVRFGLALLERWRATRERVPALPGLGELPLRLGCHFGECTPMPGGPGWIGRANAVAKRVESEAEPDSLYVTETVLDLLDLPIYRFDEVGPRTLKGDHLGRRVLYRISSVDVEGKPADELTALDWFTKAVALVGTPLENSPEEERCYREALRLRADYAEAHNNLAILLRARGDLAAAAEHYREALRIRPEYAEAHYNYARLLAARSSLVGAAEHYVEALRLRPDYVDAHQGYAELLRARGQLDDASAHYEAALRIRPDYAEAHNNYAILLEDLGRLDDAAEHYREALRIRPDYAEAHYNFALLEEKRGDGAAAERHYRAAIEAWPDYGEAHNNLAVLLQLRGDFDGAATHYGEAVRLRPDDPEAHYNYGLLLRARGDGEGGERHLRIAHELAPDVAAFRSALEAPGR